MTSRRTLLALASLFALMGPAQAQNAAEISEALTLLTQHVAGASTMDELSMRFNVLSMANTPAFTADEVVKRAGSFLDFVKDKPATAASNT